MKVVFDDLLHRKAEEKRKQGQKSIATMKTTWRSSNISQIHRNY